MDTDVISLVFKRDSRAEAYLSALESADPSGLVHDRSRVGTLDIAGEVGTGAHQPLPGLHEMKRFISVPSSRDLIVGWAEVMVMARAAGRRIEAADAWIAATALVHEAALVTNNPGDYAGVTGLKFLPR